ncbi:MAG TPA: TonB-dependent receptor [Ramlibacter sp.]
MNSMKNLRRAAASRAVLGVVCASAAIATAPRAAAQSSSLERVEITGSSIRRVDAETALPVQVITRDEIQRSGVTSTEDLLMSVTSAASSGGVTNATGAGQSTYGQSSVSLRGLGSQRTLVLVNGRRLAPFAADGSAVNVNAIPLAAVERVEVLKDGASSLYGSDAIAGVVNFILRKQFKGVEAQAGYGSPTQSGGGQNANAALTAGFGDGERASGVFSASYEKDKALFGSQRPYAASGVRLPFYVNGATGQGNIEGGITGTYPNDRYQGSAGPGPTGAGETGFGSSPGTGYGNPLALTDQCAALQMFKNPTPTTKNAPYCAFDSAPFVGLLPDRELFSLTANGSFRLTPQVEFFGDALWSRSAVTQTFQPSPARRSFFVSDNAILDAGVEPALVIYPNNPNYPTAYLTQMGYTGLIGKPLAITSRVFDYGPRINTDDSTQTRLVAGVRGSIANQEYEIAGTFNENKIAGSVSSGYFSQLGYTRIINDPASNWNPWAPGGVQTGALAQALQGAEYKGPTLNARSRTQGLDGTLRGDVFAAPGGTAQYAAGVQLRKESITTSPSDALETGDIAGLGGSVPAVDRSRRITSGFAELNVPVTKQLELNGSARVDRYNDVGNSTTYKANARYQPTNTVLLRGSVGTGFRAPTLFDLWTPQSLGTSEAFCDPATSQCQLQVNAITGGNPNVKPEKSKQWSLGFVLSPARSLSFGLDWFDYKITNVLATPSAQEIVSRFRAGDPAYRDLVVLAGNDVDTVKEVISNVGSARASGFDAFANWRLPLAVGRLDVAYNGTYMNRFDVTSPGGTVSHEVATIVQPDGSPVISTGPFTGQGVVLRWKHNLTVAYTLKQWTAALTQHYTSRYRAGDDLNGNPTYVGSYSIFDANLTYSGIKDLTLSLGAKNVFDKQPAIYVFVSNQFQYGYDISQYDPRGRFVYFRATYRFK